MGEMHSQTHQVAVRTECWEVMAVKGLCSVLAIQQKPKKCQLLLFRTVMEKREVKRSPVGPFLQSLVSQGEVWTSSMDITRSVRDAGSQAPLYLQVQELHLEDSGDAHYQWSSTKHHIFPAHQNHLNTSKIPMPGAHPRDSRVISLGCGPA